MIHGAYGGPDENWFGWLANQVRDAGHMVQIPTFPTPENQTLENWQQIFSRDVGDLHDQMILVGHSLAPSFICRLLEKTTAKVPAIFLASAFDQKLGLEEFDPINASFIEGEFDWQKVRDHVGDVFCYHGDDDPYVPLDIGKNFAASLGGDFKIIQKGGHLNLSAGYDHFFELWNDLKKYL